LFWERWIKNTIKNVTMVVLVLMTSCQVSEYPKMGPHAIQIRITATAIPNAQELPVQRVALREKLSMKFTRGAWLVMPCVLAGHGRKPSG
jgi:hypothetical protein